MSYLEMLDAAWQDHLAPKPDIAPTVISLFAGCGGSSLGYSMAGFRELLAVEWDAKAVATFRQNFPDVPVWKGDICQLTSEKAMNLTGLQPGELDVLDGSPPCQGFSTAGKREFTDQRNQLFREYVRLLKALKPKAFVMENVNGMAKGKMKLVFAECMRELKAAGYRVKCGLLDAQWLGIPQSRKRLIWSGYRLGMEQSPGFPKPFGKPIIPSEAWIGLIQDEEALVPTHLKTTWQMYRVLHGQEAPRHFGLVQLKQNRPSPTIVKDAGNTSTGMIHPSECRRLSIPEIKRLSSYPDQFLVSGRYKEQWAQIGNSVPPLMMRAIAEQVKRQLMVAPGLPAPVGSSTPTRSLEV